MGCTRTTSMQQAARDAAFNDEVIRQGGAVIYGVLRLHYQDMGYWLQHITRAVRWTQRRRVKCFVTLAAGHTAGNACWDDASTYIVLVLGCANAPSAWHDINEQWPCPLADRCIVEDTPARAFLVNVSHDVGVLPLRP